MGMIVYKLIVKGKTGKYGNFCRNEVQPVNFGLNLIYPCLPRPLLATESPQNHAPVKVWLSR